MDRFAWLSAGKEGKWKSIREDGREWTWYMLRDGQIPHGPPALLSNDEDWLKGQQWSGQAMAEKRSLYATRPLSREYGLAANQLKYHKRDGTLAHTTIPPGITGMSGLIALCGM